MKSYSSSQQLLHQDNRIFIYTEIFRTTEYPNKNNENITFDELPDILFNKVKLRAAYRLNEKETLGSDSIDF